nr:50S ribosomal protein L25 [Anaerolineae bacterium]
MSDPLKLEIQNRDIIGKKVRHLRREGLIPAVVYGPESEPITISIQQGPLRQTLLDAGGTQVIELQLGKEAIPVLARKVQREPIRGDILHVDFYRVSMTRLIAADVPILLVNESPAVESGMGTIMQGMSNLSIEALPGDLPSHIEVDISKLDEVGMQITVGELDLPKGCTAQTDLNELVIKIDYMRLEEEIKEEVEKEELFIDGEQEVEVIRERREEDEED